jgi:protein-L-isoaspartate(D-aspartate) O-methyltransferase
MDTHFASLRQFMAQEIAEHASSAGRQIGKPLLDARVTAAMGRIPWEAFVPPELRVYAYVDSPIPIGFRKTVSQPFMIALMADLLELGAGASGGPGSAITRPFSQSSPERFIRSRSTGT